MHIEVEGSSNIKSIDYKDSNLVVQFLNGGRYKFPDFPVSVFNEFAQAESKGKYFAANIKGQYTSVKL